jgi:UDP-N-acetylmuramyl pentapeptide phosphotransferase/UDP-N-acetylglucosamine-1-phosphate transferase
MTAFVVALVVALLGTPVVVKLVRRWQLIDVPNHRSSHETPVPRGGGLAVAVATVVGVAAAAVWSQAVVGLVVGAVVLGATGLADDWRGLPAMPRLVVQVLTPLAIAVVVVDRDGWQLVVGVALVVIVIAGYVNAFNFMDGINGISGTQAAIAGGFLAAAANHIAVEPLALAGWAVCGASLGFLPFNAVHARVFLGDVGSYFLGFWLAGLALLVVDAGVPAVVVVGPFLLYLFDTATVLVWRARRGESLMEAHREHAYQRLVQLGWSHVAVSSLCAVVSAVCAVIMYSVIDASPRMQLVALAGCCALVTGYLLLPGALSRRVERQPEAAA